MVPSDADTSPRPPTSASTTSARRASTRWCVRASWIVATDAQASRVQAYSLDHQIGVSAVFSLETAHDMDCADMLDFLATDPHTQIVFVALTHLARPSRFLSAARACTRNKPVFAWCVAPDGQGQPVYQAAIERTGFVRVNDFEQLLDASQTAEAQGIQQGPLIESYREQMRRIMATPPLPAPDVRGLRAAHAHARQWIDRIETRGTDLPLWIDSNEAQMLLACFGLHADTNGSVDTDVEADNTIGVDIEADEGIKADAAIKAISGSDNGMTAVDYTIEVEIHDDPGFGAVMTLTPGSRLAHRPNIDSASEDRGSPRTVTHLLPVDTTLVFDSLHDLMGVNDPKDPTDTPRPTDARRLPGRDIAQAAYALETLSAIVCGQSRLGAMTGQLAYSAGRWYFACARVLIVARGRRHPLSIRPYPFNLEQTIDWDGVALTFRPIRPEDEPHHAGLFRAQTPEDLYLRFFSMQREPDHARLARLVRIDYAREMAIIACSGPADQLVVHGVARAVSCVEAHGAGESAEFAVAIRSDEKGHHLGRMLMERIIDYCRGRGMARIVGVVLKENRRMLALAQDCGFERQTNEDPTIWSIVLPLQDQAINTARRPDNRA